MNTVNKANNRYLYSVYLSFPSNENARNSKYVSIAVYFV